MADLKSPVEGPTRLTAAARYQHLETTRRPYLERARECASYTIPGLMPPEGSSGATEFQTPWQSTGADGVNCLASSLVLGLFPPNGSCFRLKVDGFVLDKLMQQAGSADAQSAARADVETALGKMERSVKDRMEQKGNRTVNFTGIQHLIVTGNGLVYVEEDGSEKFFPLDRYVCKRDLSGNPLEILTKECLPRTSLPTAVQAMLSQSPDQPANDEQKTTELYTWVKRTAKGAWTVHQEVENQIVPGSMGTYPKGKCAWLPLRWRAVPGEDYGRGHCEEYLGDLRSLDNLTMAIVRFAVVASKVVILVDESGTTRKVDIASAQSGAVKDGNAKDVTVLQLEKAQDFQVAQTVKAEIEQRLDRAFLKASSVQRNAERVTAEEIRVMIGQLEQTLGGVYSILSEEFQRPLVVRILTQMQRKGELPALPEGVVSPQIVTGLEGLGRSSDLNKLDTLIQGIAQLLGPEAVAEYVNAGALIKMRGTALGLDLTGLIRSDDEVQQMRQQKQMSEMAKTALPPGIKAVSDQALAAQTQAQPSAA